MNLTQLGAILVVKLAGTYWMTLKVVKKTQNKTKAQPKGKTKKKKKLLWEIKNCDFLEPK